MILAGICAIKMHIVLSLSRPSSLILHLLEPLKEKNSDPQLNEKKKHDSSYWKKKNYDPPPVKLKPPTPINKYSNDNPLKAYFLQELRQVRYSIL